MKKILFILTILLSSCYWTEDLNNYNNYNTESSRQSIFFWYYDHDMFINTDSVHLVGQLESKYSNEIHYVNRSCKVYNDTIYISRKDNYPLHYIYKGNIRVNNIIHDVNIILQ